MKTAWECQKSDPKFLFSYKEPNLDDLNNKLYNPPTDLSYFIIAITVGYWKQQFLLLLSEILLKVHYRLNVVVWLYIFLNKFYATKNSQT